MADRLLLENGTDALLLEDNTSPVSALNLERLSGIDPTRSITGWVLGDGWYHGGGSPLQYACVDGTQNSESALTQTLTTVPGAYYTLSIDIVSVGSPVGYIKVKADDFVVIDRVSTVATHTGGFSPSGSSVSLQIIASVDFTGCVDNVSAIPDKYYITEWIRSSLTLDGLPDSNVPEAVKVNYTIPSDTAAAWKQDSFTVISADVVI